MNASTQEERIHLVDIAAVVYRRRWLIAGGTLVGVGLVMLLALFTPAKSEFRAVAEIGRLVDKPQAAETDVDKILRLVAHMTRGSRRPEGYSYVEDPKEASERLIAFAYSVYQSRYVDEGIEAPFSIDKDFRSRMIVSSAGDNTFLVEASLTAPAEFDDAAEFVREVIAGLIAFHDEVVAGYRGEMEAEVARLRDRLRRENERKESVERRLAALAEERNRLATLASELERRIREASAIEAEGLSEAPADRLAQVLLADELQRQRSTLDEIQVRLASGIPDRASELRLDIDRIETESERIEGMLQGMARAIESSAPTRLIASPREGGKPIETPYGLYAVLGALMGGFLALFTAFLLEFWSGNRSQITSG